MKLKHLCLTLIIASLVVMHPGTASATTDVTEAQLRQALILLINSLQAEIAKRTSTSDRPLNEIEPASDGDRIVAVYNVHDDSLTLSSGANRTEYREYWETATTIIPASLTERVGQFVIYKNEKSLTDAYVENMYTDGNDIWRLAINFATYEEDPDSGTQAELLVHEFAHILSLNETQINYFIDPDECTTYLTSEGCPESDSYYQELIDYYWNDDLLELSEVAAEADDPENEIDEYYEEYEDWFVSDYAATNPAEDWAETFAHFVADPLPTGDTIAEQKIQSFYTYSELVSLRKKIRKNFDF